MSRKKTTIYLDDDQAERLSRLASAAGRSQAELIRDAIDSALDAAPARTFHSLGLGRGGGARPRRWTSDEVYEKTGGRRGR